MSPIFEGQKTCRRLCDFYEGKSLFITGTTGYVGSVLLEVLLRCFPGIARIYILLRSKKGIEPQSRKCTIFEKKVFIDLMEKCPEVKDKVHVVCGDISKPNLGLNEDDIFKITQEVSIVFHCAAVVSFIKPMRYTVLHNSKGTDNIVELCRKLKQLDVLVYTSTAYSNSFCWPERIEERIYRLPFPAQRFLDELENGNDETFDQLVSTCPVCPTPYIFSKCLAESILRDKASDLPVVIIRPAIVVSIWKSPLPGYVEEGSGLSNLSEAVGKGFIRVINADPEAKLDFIPSDIVANAHIAAAGIMADGRCASPFIVNCTSGEFLKPTFGHYISCMFEMLRTNQLPKRFQEPSDKVIPNKFLYWMVALYQHYIPAVVLDIVLRLKGKKLRLVPMYRFFDNIMTSMNFFMMRTFEFDRDNFESISQLLSPEDNEIIYTDCREIVFEDMVADIPTGSEYFNWKKDKMSPNKRKHVVYVRSMVMTFIKRISLFLICYLIYRIFKLFLGSF